VRVGSCRCGGLAYVLMRHDEFENMQGKKQSILDLLNQSDGKDFDVSIPKLGRIAKTVDLD
jgi:hypothetical protein